MTIFPPDPDLNALRPELAPLPAARGWSYDELAARGGLARRAVIEIKVERTIGALKTWHALAHALDTRFDELFDVDALCHEHARPGVAVE
ncbi:helix-turn-helix transcriptional regulator [Streptomyces himastatinicus]|uniref:helix-turn-helix transcriptional regulator n=1 Tax=Streptomyces himastatinicus TaxID=998084 RepID=UPI0001B4FB38|nr:helix-turn-helix transcriptional regulator [Streptomyces himastatinicus]